MHACMQCVRVQHAPHLEAGGHDTGDHDDGVVTDDALRCELASGPRCDLVRDRARVGGQHLAQISHRDVGVERAR